MKPLRLAVIGIGSVRSGPAIVASLASYFGERELEVRLYDADPERLDLFARLARNCFLVEKSKHLLEVQSDWEEALEDADFVIFAASENCARKFLKVPCDSPRTRDSLIDEMFDLVKSRSVGVSMLVISRDVELELPPSAIHLKWPEDIGDNERLGMAHQVLRWIKGDDYLFYLIDRYRLSPLRAWLDGPRSEL